MLVNETHRELKVSTCKSSFSTCREYGRERYQVGIKAAQDNVARFQLYSTAYHRQQYFEASIVHYTNESTTQPRFPGFKCMDIVGQKKDMKIGNCDAWIMVTILIGSVRFVRS